MLNPPPLRPVQMDELIVTSGPGIRKPWPIFATPAAPSRRLGSLGAVNEAGPWVALLK